MFQQRVMAIPGVLSLVVLIALCSVADASLFTPNAINELEDEDWETLSDVDTSSTLNSGDYLVGMFQIQELNALPSTGNSTNAVTAVFALQVLATDVNATRHFGGANPTELYLGPIDPGAGGAGSATDPWSTIWGITRSDAGTMAVLYDDRPSLGVDPNAGSVSASLATAEDGTMLWEVGFVGGSIDVSTGKTSGPDGIGGTSDDEFWEAEVNDHSLPPPDGLALRYMANLNVTVQGAGLPVVPHNFLDSQGFASTIYPGPATGEFQLEGGKGAGVPGVFQLNTDTNIYLLPVPEPATCIVWLVLGAFGVVVASRSRRKNT